MDQRYILTPYAYHSLIARKNEVSRRKGSIKNLSWFLMEIEDDWGEATYPCEEELQHHNCSKGCGKDTARAQYTSVSTEKGSKPSTQK